MLSPRYVGTTAADLEAEQSESSDAQTGPSDRRKGAGWRRAFKKEKEREQTLQVPTSTGLQPSLSGASSHSEDTGRKGSMQNSVSIQTRRPSTSSAARTEHSDTHSQGQSQLRAVRNPPLQGHGKEGAGSMSKRDAKKAAEQTPQFSAEAIRDAVSAIVS